MPFSRLNSDIAHDFGIDADYLAHPDTAARIRTANAHLDNSVILALGKELSKVHGKIKKAHPADGQFQSAVQGLGRRRRHDGRNLREQGAEFLLGCKRDEGLAHGSPRYSSLSTSDLSSPSSSAILSSESIQGFSTSQRATATAVDFTRHSSKSSPMLSA